MKWSLKRWTVASVERMRRSLLELVFPGVCRLCNAPVRIPADFCLRCESDLTISEPLMRDHCHRCGSPMIVAAGRGNQSARPAGSPRPVEINHRDASPQFASVAASQRLKTADDDLPLRSQSQPHQAQDLGCPHCRKRPFEFDTVVALWAYQSRVRDAVVASKYPCHAAVGDALGRRLGTRVVSRLAASRPDVVTHVAACMSRRVSRGGVGSAVIAAAVARKIHRPCRDLLRTTRSTAKQAWLNDEDRVQNVAGAFTIKKGYALRRAPQLPYRHILVVDDVLTTGATANEVARVLREGGADRVSLAVVARAIRS